MNYSRDARVAGVFCFAFLPRAWLIVRLAARGRLPKWPTGADCKSAGLRLRWFESITYHHLLPAFSDHYFISRKNIRGPEIILVRTFCPLMLAGVPETVLQITGGERLVADCNTN